MPAPHITITSFPVFSTSATASIVSSRGWVLQFIVGGGGHRIKDCEYRVDSRLLNNILNI